MYALTLLPHRLCLPSLGAWYQNQSKITILLPTCWMAKERTKHKFTLKVWIHAAVTFLIITHHHPSKLHFPYMKREIWIWSDICCCKTYCTLIFLVNVDILFSKYSRKDRHVWSVRNDSVPISLVLPVAALHLYRVTAWAMPFTSRCCLRTCPNHRIIHVQQQW